MILRSGPPWNKQVQLINKINWNMTISRNEAQYKLTLHLDHFTTIMKINQTIYLWPASYGPGENTCVCQRHLASVQRRRNKIRPQEYYLQPCSFLLMVNRNAWQAMKSAKKTWHTNNSPVELKQGQHIPVDYKQNMEPEKNTPNLLCGYSKLTFSKNFSTTYNNRTIQESPLPSTSLSTDECYCTNDKGKTR
jgi:hypothetical protein